MPGGSPGLWRLADITGGHFTEATGDLTIAMARARRDVACRYALGVYDREKDPKPYREVSIRMKRPGLRAIHPNSYNFRTPEEKRSALLRAAFQAPERFQDGVIRGHVFLLQPGPKKSWEGLLVVSFPVSMQGDAARVARDFGGLLYSGSKVAYSFDRRVTLTPAAGTPEGHRQRITFLQPLDLRPGDYTLRVSLSDPGGTTPSMWREQISVPKLPAKETVLVGPILGRQAREDIVLIAKEQDGGKSARRRKDAPHPSRDDRVGSDSAFEPLLVDQVGAGEPTLAAVTVICGDPADSDLSGGAPVKRALLTSEGAIAGSVENRTVALEGETAPSCVLLTDVLNTDRMKQGEYVFEAVLSTPSEGSASRTGRASFAVLTGQGAGASTSPGPPPK